MPTVRDVDALLVWGGDPLFLANWMRRSGLTGLLPTLRSEAVYVGVSAGSIAAASTFVETYNEPPRGNDGPLKSEDIVFATSQGDVDRIVVTGQGAGLVDFAVIPHLEHPDHPDASLANAERWAARIPAPTYAIDDETAIRVVDGAARSSPRGTGNCSSPNGTGQLLKPELAAADVARLRVLGERQRRTSGTKVLATIPSSAHRRPRRDGFARGSAARVVSCRHTCPHPVHRYRRIVMTKVVGRHCSTALRRPLALNPQLLRARNPHQSHRRSKIIVHATLAT